MEPLTIVFISVWFYGSPLQPSAIKVQLTSRTWAIPLEPQLSLSNAKITGHYEMEPYYALRVIDLNDGNKNKVEMRRLTSRKNASTPSTVKTTRPIYIQRSYRTTL